MPDTKTAQHTHDWTVVTPYKYKGTYEIAAAIDGEHEANAHLIAAAPDLLELLRWFSDVTVAGPDPELQAKLREARTAIAKAKGEDPNA